MVKQWKFQRIVMMVALVGVLTVALVFSIGTSAAQDSDEAATDTGYGAMNGVGPGDYRLLLQNLPPATEGGLTTEAKAALIRGILDEYHAYAVYQAVIDQFGPVAPFIRIQASEAQHIAALEMLFERYDLTVPTPNPLEDLPEFASLAEACELAAEAEIANFDLYDAWLDQVSDYPDLVQVFTALRNASEFKHLPAFEMCAQ